LWRVPGAAPVGGVLDLIEELPALCAEIDRLCRLLAQARHAYADLVAAARATLAAQEEAESDPWWYLRDELGAQLHLPADPTDTAGAGAGRPGCGGGACA
jgi:hypothetical protein